MKLRLPLSLQAILFTLIVSTSTYGAALIWEDNGGDNNWFTASNWNANNIPQTGDSVAINDSSYNVLLDKTKTLGATDPTIAHFAVTNGKLTIADTKLTMTAAGGYGILANGDKAKAELVIESGGEFVYAPSRAGAGKNSTHQLLIAHTATGVGTLTIKSGGKLTIDTSDVASTDYGKDANKGLLQVGSVGTGIFNVEKGGSATVVHLRAGNGGTAQGYINVKGGTVTVTKNMHIGNMESAKGFVNITNEGKLITKGASYIGNQSTTEGSVTLDNGSWEASSWVAIGESSIGTLSIKNNGAFTTTSTLYVGHLADGNGTVTIDSGTVTASSLSMAAATNTKAKVTLNSGSMTVSNTSAIGGGENGDALIALNGGKLTTTKAMTLAGGKNSTAKIVANSGTWEGLDVNIATRGSGSVILNNNVVVNVDSFKFGNTSSSALYTDATGLLEINSAGISLKSKDGSGLSVNMEMTTVKAP